MKYELSEKEIAAIEKAIKEAKGTFEIILKPENGKIAVIESQRKLKEIV